jgi:hypothetical protein
MIAGRITFHARNLRGCRNNLAHAPSADLSRGKIVSLTPRNASIANHERTDATKELNESANT